MNAMTGVTMAARSRRRTSGLKLIGKQAVDEGTPETRARLQPPPWQGWPQELQDAAAAIELAIRLQAGGCMAQAQDMLHVRHHAGESAEEWQARLERRYAWWRWEVVRTRGWSLSAVVSCVVEHGPQPLYLVDALTLFANAPRSVWS